MAWVLRWPTSKHDSPDSLGHTTGRPSGTVRSIQTSLRAALSVEAEIAEWKAWLQHPNPAIRWEAFKLAQAYLYKKPVQPTDSTPVQIEPVTVRVEHIGASADFFAQQAKVLGLK